jgi:long-subunit acyl-CoA synthetase (AMP-forming)
LYITPAYSDLNEDEPMFANIVLQTDDLKWLLPLGVGALVLLICVIAVFSNIRRDWVLIVMAVLSVAMIGASVFSKISLTREGVIVETAQLSAKVLVDLQTAAKANSDSIGQLNSRLDQLADVVKKIADTQPAAASHSETLGQIKSNTQQIQNAVKSNEDLLKGVGQSNEILKMQLNKLRF